MNDINCKKIVALLKSDFGSLWHCFNRGETLEFVTPFLYPDKSFVSVFITTREKRIIVSEGGHLSEFIKAATDDEAFQTAILGKFKESYGVKKFSQKQREFYFKECSDFKLIPSIVFDLCNFVVSASSASVLAVTEEEALERKSFRTKADKFLKLNIQQRKVHFNYRLPEIEEARFSAVITSDSKLWLVLYLTGSNLNYFTRSVSNAIVDIKFARESKIKSHIAAAIPLVNNQATGYQPEKLLHRIKWLEDEAQTKVLPWTDRESITKRLAI